jgi:hypothetical protein
MATNVAPTMLFRPNRRSSATSDSGERLSLLDVQAVVLYALGMFGFGLILTLERFLSLPERALTVPYRLLMLLASVAIIMTVLATSRRFLFRSYLFPLGIFWLAYVVRFIVDVYVRELPLAQTPSDLFFYIIGMCLIPMTAMLLYSSERFASAAVLTSLVVASLACAAILLFCRDILFTEFGRLRVEGGLNQITLGHLGVSLTTLSLFLVLSRRPIVQVPRVVLAALIVFGLLVVGLASSRGPLVAMVVMLPLLVVFAWCQGRKTTTLVVTLIATLSIPSGILVLKSLGSNIDQRITATVERTESGKESRLDLWQSAWEDFLDHPLTGRAMEGRYDIYPHNLLIESFMATGMLGGGSFLWALLFGLRAAFHLIWRSHEYGWIGFLFIQMTVYGCFSGSLWSLAGFWYMLAAVLVYGHGACVTTASPAPLRNNTYAFAMSSGRK